MNQSKLEARKEYDATSRCPDKWREEVALSNITRHKSQMVSIRGFKTVMGQEDTCIWYAMCFFIR